MNDEHHNPMTGDNADNPKIPRPLATPPMASKPCTLSQATDYIEQLWRLVDGDLPEDLETKLRRHTDACAYCTSRLVNMARADETAELQELPRSAEQVWAAATLAPVTESAGRASSPIEELYRLAVAIKDDLIEILRNPGRLVPQAALATRGDESATDGKSTVIELSCKGVICRICLTNGEEHTCNASVQFDLNPNQRAAQPAVSLFNSEGQELESRPYRPEGVTFSRLPAGNYFIRLYTVQETVVSFGMEINR